MSSVSLSHLDKRYGSVGVVHDVSLEIHDGEFVVFVGPSGCGKSTLLRMVAGLESISSGEISIDSEIVNSVPVRDRGVSMVFQNYALYPHMSVYENMAFGLRNIGVAKSEIERRVMQAADILQIEPLLQRRPQQMSGGQRQRVAIGRAIVRDPKVFLFDEPLSNLDAALRVQMRTELTKLHHRLGATMIYVTHDQTEAMTMADRIVVLRDGKVEQVGSPLELYNRPANIFVASFLGLPKMNLMKGVVSSVRGKSALIAFGGTYSVSVNFVAGTLNSGDLVTIGLRPESFILDRKGDIKGIVELVEHLGRTSLVYLVLPSQEQIVVEQPSDIYTKIGDELTFTVPTLGTHIFTKNGESVTRHEKETATGEGPK